MKLIVLSVAAFAAGLSAAEAQSVNIVGAHIALPAVTTSVGASTAATVGVASSAAIATSVGTVPSVPSLPSVPNVSPAPTPPGSSMSAGATVQ